MSAKTAPTAPAEKKTKVAIVGFAPSWKDAPYADESWEIWGLNELYLRLKEHPHGRADRWFELHNRESPSKNRPDHIKTLQGMPIPVYMWQHYEDIPNSLTFPKEPVIAWLAERGYAGRRYFTNSISWMTAFALYEGFQEIAVYGVDMAQDSEYAHQRPSCEYFIGLAEGMGVKFTVADGSDLLKNAQLYGFESDNAMRVKLKAKIKELGEQRAKAQQQKAQLIQQVQALEVSIGQLSGAISMNEHWLKNWTVGG